MTEHPRREKNERNEKPLFKYHVGLKNLENH